MLFLKQGIQLAAINEAKPGRDAAIMFTVLRTVAALAGASQSDELPDTVAVHDAFHLVRLEFDDQKSWKMSASSINSSSRAPHSSPPLRARIDRDIAAGLVALDDLCRYVELQGVILRAVASE